MRSNDFGRLTLAALALFAGGCMSMQPTAFPVGTRRLPPKPPQARILLFKDSAPNRPFEPVARLNVHIEKTFFIPSAFAEALPELEKLARQNGADALMDVAEKKSRLNETFIYNVTATAVTFSAEPGINAAAPGR